MTWRSKGSLRREIKHLEGKLFTKEITLIEQHLDKANLRSDRQNVAKDLMEVLGVVGNYSVFAYAADGEIERFIADRKLHRTEEARKAAIKRATEKGE